MYKKFKLIGKRYDLKNEKFDRWKVIKKVPNKNGVTAWLCVCDCGNKRIITTTSLIHKSSRSCGCLQLDSVVKHGMSRHPIYNVYVDMMTRCYNKKYNGFHNYGGRGIKVSIRWKNSPERFIKWAEKNGWKKGLALDRKNSNKHYNPNNCRFVTQRKNNINRRLFKNSKSGFVGVNKSGSRWAARIRVEGKYIWIGTFDTPLKAALSRDSYIIDNNLIDYQLSTGESYE